MYSTCSTTLLDIQVLYMYNCEKKNFFGGGGVQALSCISGNLEKFLKGGAGLQGVVTLTVSRDNSKWVILSTIGPQNRVAAQMTFFGIKFSNRNGGGGGGYTTLSHHPLKTCLLACNEVMNKNVTMYNGWIILSFVCTLLDLIGMLIA